MKRARPLIFGEVLFDRFPDGSEVLGGAPFNTAWHLHGFGAEPLFVSRVGEDAAGTRVLAAMRAWGMDVSAMQTDPAHATGSVEVALVDGEPSYRIQPEQAYGHIEPPGGIAEPALLYHGSLALWAADSRRALDDLAGRWRAPIFLDVNLRPPWWREADLAGWIGRATWVKLNSDELDRLGAGSGSPAERAGRLMARYDLERVILTLGEEGALAVDRNGSAQVAPAGRVEVVDTVGAGDAFASVSMLGLLEGWPLDVSLRRAQDFASAVVGQRGATAADPAYYRRFAEAWGRS